MVFRPERFLKTATHEPEPDPRHFIFGYGRRICPGRWTADNALFITISQTLAVYNIDKPVENGKVIEPEVKFEAGTISHPCPFKADIKSRSEKHRQLIENLVNEYPWEESHAKDLESIKW
jgi:hypothetical protein